VGDKTSDEGFEFIAREVKGLRISKIQVRKLSANGRYRSDDDLPEQSAAEPAGEEPVKKDDASTEAPETAGEYESEDQAENRKES
jgi:hypothetical protein